MGPAAIRRGQGEGRGAAVLAVTDEGDARGPVVMAVAILAFIGSSFLAIHLRYLPDAPARGLGAPPALATPLAAALPVALAGPVAGAREETADPSAPPGLGVLRPLPAPAASGEWERRVNECVQRNLQGSRRGEAKRALPGRWPALKRAREERRLNRLAARAVCERDLAR